MFFIVFHCSFLEAGKLENSEAVAVGQMPCHQVSPRISMDLHGFTIVLRGILREPRDVAVPI